MTQSILQEPESLAWCRHFAAIQGDALPWDDRTYLTPLEKRTIAKSIQQFQLGEGSEGRQLKKRGLQFARSVGDADFIEALNLFIREEQRHSEYLLRFMQRQGIPRLRKHWVDSVFRKIRALSGLELELRVLVSAEVISVPYYRALGRATGSPLLKAICERILEDEAGHLRFQRWMLGRLEQTRPHKGLVRLAHRLFVVGTCGLVWLEHGSVFRAAGYGWKQLVQESLEALNHVHLSATSP